jgi:hypothetical protein
VKVELICVCSAADDLEHVHTLKSLVTTLENVREAKLRDSLQNIKTGGGWAKVNHATKLEIEKIRPYLLPAMDQFAKIQAVISAAGEKENDLQEYEEDEQVPTNLRPFRS